MKIKYFILIIVFSVLSVLTVTSCSSVNDSKNISEDLQIINYDVTYKQNVSNVTLNFGFLESNLKIDNLFITCDGISRTVAYREEVFKDNFLYKWNTTVFTRELYINDNVVKNIEFYVEYDGCIVLIDSKQVSFKKYKGSSPVDLPTVS